MTRVKVCCIHSVEEARLSVRLGASALGLVSEMPSGPGVISEETIAEIASVVPPPIGRFLLTSRTDAGEIGAQQRRCGVNTVQICDRVPAGAHAELRAALPGISLVQVVHVTGEESVREALEVGSLVDALLLDSGNQALAVKELGGTGRTHDWGVSAEIVRRSPVPVFLAGGLNAANVGEAIGRVRPFGVDVCSGVRTDGGLDAGKLEQFMVAVGRAGTGGAA
ncbi:MAG: phosphoribosylanthranilate isomerase [Polyangiaceae bacterium]